LAEEIRRLRHDYEQPLTLAVLGEFNAGKSTFINDLLGEELLPTDVVPTTATINLLKYGDSPSARLMWQDGSIEEISMEQLRQYVTASPTALWTILPSAPS
jgi:septin family protein